jgi:hypothetical protein
MAGLGKYLTLFLVVIFAVSSMLIVLPTNAQSIPKPSVPDFTIQIVASPYDVPTTTTIDPYSGKEIVHQGYHVENNTIQVKIKNQAFNPFVITENGNSWTINLNYNIRIRGHFAQQSQDWIELYRASDGYPHQWSDSDYTILSYPIGVNSHTFMGTIMIDLKAGDKVDFQVEAMSGYTTREVTSIPGAGWTFNGVTSGWSNTQTITIPYSSASVTPAPSSTNSQSSTTPTLPPDTISDNSTLIVFSIVVVILVISIISLLMYVRHLKRRMPKSSSSAIN